VIKLLLYCLHLQIAPKRFLRNLGSLLRYIYAVVILQTTIRKLGHATHNNHVFFLLPLQEAYRRWVCASLFAHFLQDSGERARPCRSVCQQVEQRCPFFLPGDRFPSYPTQYAGEPTFLCIGMSSIKANYDLQLFVEITPCRLIYNYGRFEESSCLHLKGLSSSKRLIVRN